MGTIKNNRGRDVPVEMIRKDHLKEHRTVEKIFDNITKFQSKLAKEKEKLMELILKYKMYEAKHHKVDFEGFENATLSNYPNTKAIDYKTNNFVAFDDKIRLAQQIIIDLTREWTKKSKNNYLTILIEEAFKPDHLGLLDGKKILSLRSYKIDHPKWQQAMKIIEESRVVKNKKCYINFRYRDNNNSKWKTLNLNFSSIESESKQVV